MFDPNVRGNITWGLPAPRYMEKPTWLERLARLIRRDAKASAPRQPIVRQFDGEAAREAMRRTAAQTEWDQYTRWSIQ